MVTLYSLLQEVVSGREGGTWGEADGVEVVMEPRGPGVEEGKG